MLVSWFLLMQALAFVLSSACDSLEDCNLNGECVNNSCHCDAWWSGEKCSALKFAPASAKFAYKKEHGANGLV